MIDSELIPSLEFNVEPTHSIKKQEAVWIEVSTTDKAVVWKKGRR
jgi:hypothetical protein